MKARHLTSTVVLLLVAALLQGLLARPPATQGQSGNLALGKPATSSSNETAGLTPNLAVDGSAGTRWASAYSDPQWIRVDLGAPTSISRVVLRWEAAYGRAYQIQTSNDGSSWATIYSTTSGDGGVDDLTGLAGSGRYVRMYGSARATSWGYSLWELEVYSAAAPSPTRTRTATGAAATATRTRTPTAPSGGTVLLQDDFNGTTLDTGKWTAVRQQWGGAGVNGGVVPENVHVHDGYLWLEGHGDQYTGPVQGIGRNTRVGAVISSLARYGQARYEVRAKVLPRLGAVSAIWTYYSGNNDTLNHEIDIEMPGRTCYEGCTDYRFDNVLLTTWTSISNFTATFNDIAPQNDGQFHTYRFDWYDGRDGGQKRVVYYIDNMTTPFRTLTTNVPDIASEFWVGVWFPNGWAGTPNFNVENMVVDYVRISSLGGTTNPPPATATPLRTPTSPPTAVNLALGRTASASSFVAGYEPAKALDGSTATWYGSGQSVTQAWISVDLGAARTFNTVVLKWGPSAYARSFKIQTSSDNVTWTDRYVTTAGPGGNQTISFPAVSARYVRMNGTATNGLGYDIFEYEVYNR